MTMLSKTNEQTNKTRKAKQPKHRNKKRKIWDKIEVIKNATIMYISKECYGYVVLLQVKMVKQSIN